MTKIDSGSQVERQQIWNLRKPAKTSASGTVVSHHPAASEIGAKVLREGGNAMDAAIATSFAITVLEPWMSGIGGGGFMTVYSAKEKKVRTIHFGMKSPAGLNPADYVLDESGEGGDLFSWPKVKGDINVNGWKSIGVPGHLAGIDLAFKRFATKPWASLIGPSIALARRGLPIGWHATLRIASAMSQLRKDPTASEIYLPGGVPPVGVAGQKIPYVDLGPLATTFETIARDGVAAFYDGPLGQSIASDVQSAGGDLSFEDLQSYTAEERDPLSFAYGDATVNTVDGLSAGPTLKHAMALLPKMSGEKNGPTPQDVAGWGTALRDSYVERFDTLGDVDDSRDPACTTNLVTSDSEGNIVVLTQTLLSIFGAKVVAPSSGILMNNGMMWFDPRPGRPNSIAPGKRPLSNMAPTIVTNSQGQPWFGLGASGGRRIFPCLLQLMSYRIDFDFDIEETFHAPRIDVCGSNYVGVDPEFSSDFFDALGDILPVVAQEHAVLPAGFAIPSAIEVSFKGDVIESTGAADPIAPLSFVAVP
jgi:gamma-glutamyltranspeptidase/glutathione hydrolase